MIDFWIVGSTIVLAGCVFCAADFGLVGCVLYFAGGGCLVNHFSVAQPLPNLVYFFLTFQLLAGVGVMYHVVRDRTLKKGVHNETEHHHLRQLRLHPGWL